MSSRRTTVLWLLFTVSCAALAVAGARREAWLTDDALIVFRYVDNILAGRGAVFNVGERVEGYSSPLFLALLVMLRGIGIASATAAAMLGVLAMIVELVVLLGVTLRVARSNVAAIVVGVAFATQRMVWVWATGGLETGFYSALLLAAFASAVLDLSVRDLSVEHASVARTTILHVLVAFCRPEGIAFLVVYLAVIAARRDRAAVLPRALNIALPAIALGLLLRYGYYRALVANPYRAKVVGVPDVGFFGRGYVEWFARRVGWLDGVHGLPWLLGIAAYLWSRKDGRREERALVLALLYIAVAFAIVIASGGDYMCDFRLLRPVVGIVLFAIATAIGLATQATERGPRLLAAAAAVALVGSHALLQRKASPVFEDAPAGPAHKRFLSVTTEQAMHFRDALLRFAEPSDAVLADKSGMMGLGHTLRTIDATGLLSSVIERDFALRETWSDLGGRERIPGHARWPRVEMLLRERVAVIFPKLSPRPPEDPEVTPRSPRRHREYPFLHATVAVGPNEYLRFFTALGADDLRQRARSRRLRVCFRAAFGPLECAQP